LADDVDNLADLERLEGRLRARTAAELDSLRARHPRGRTSSLAAGRGCAARGSSGVKGVVLAGGLGGSRLARGLAETIEPGELTIVGNVGDEVEILGLHVSPDLDTILYTLTGRLDEMKGWGRAGETWHALDTVTELGGESWFRLGDLDLGVHLVRTQALRAGEPLSLVTARLAVRSGLEPRLLPARHARLRTWLDTPAGELPFQEWFVARGHRDEVDGVRFEGAEAAGPAPGGVEALGAAARVA